jgi:hypothetical protein
LAIFSILLNKKLEVLHTLIYDQVDSSFSLSMPQRRAIMALEIQTRIVTSILLSTVILLSLAVNPTPKGGVLTSSVSADDSCGDTLQTRELTASRSSTSRPDRALDGNLSTSWTSIGNGSWIKEDFQEKKTICSVEVAWFMGDSRMYNFEILVSTDGSTWMKEFESTSSGKTTSFETYDIDNISARWIKITVSGKTTSFETYDIDNISARWIKITVSGNQWNNLNGITELKVQGFIANSQPSAMVTKSTVQSTNVTIPSTTNTTTTTSQPQAPVSTGIIPYRAMVLPYVSVSSQKEAYLTTLKSYDMVVLRVAAGTTPSPAYLELLRQLPAQKKGLEFRSIPEIQNFLKTGNKDGITFIGYVPEPEHGTPITEMNNLVSAVVKTSGIVHNAGLKFELVPRLQSNVDHAANFAPYVDYYVIMGQSFQDKGISTFESFESSISNKVNSANPKIGHVFSEESTERIPSPGLTLQQTFQQSTESTVGINGDGIVDGSSIWYNSDAELKEVKIFLVWYDAKYRQ